MNQSYKPVPARTNCVLGESSQATRALLTLLEEQIGLKVSAIPVLRISHPFPQLSNLYLGVLRDSHIAINCHKTCVPPWLVQPVCSAWSFVHHDMDYSRSPLPGQWEAAACRDALM